MIPPSLCRQIRRDFLRTSALAVTGLGLAACLREAGMLKSLPRKLIAQGTDWRFLNELKKELKA
jgi:hypothetical protein